MFDEISSPRKFRNTGKLVQLSQKNWQTVEASRLINFYVKANESGSLTPLNSDHEFINMSSYSYLGLSRHPAVIRGAIDALEDWQTLGLGITPTRIQVGLMKDTQDELSELFDATCLLSLSCSVATAAILPLISSGQLIDGKPRLTVFDKRCHFCMDLVRPICADEAETITLPHNDMNLLEDLCKRFGRVAYIADGAYSMGGVANLEAIEHLQDRYGLFVWYDDSHALSVLGGNGEGFVKSSLGELNPLTIVAASLEKGFGVSGGVLMLHRQQDVSFLNTFGGPLCWSQNLSVPNLGSIRACARLHRTQELSDLQARLRKNLALFDSLVDTPLRNSILPIRAIVLGDSEKAISTSGKLFERGFYSAPVYFPITSRGKEGLRIMIRADMLPEDIIRFAEVLTEELNAQTPYPYPITTAE